MAGLHVKDRPRAARVALYTPKLSRNPRTVAMIRNADTAKRLSLHVIPRYAGNVECFPDTSITKDSLTAPIGADKVSQEHTCRSLAHATADGTRLRGGTL